MLLIIFFMVANVHILSCSLIYRLVVLPSLKGTDYDPIATSSRIKEYRQVLRSEKQLSNQLSLRLILVRFLKLYENISFKNIGKLLFIWFFLSMIIWVVIFKV